MSARVMNPLFLSEFYKKSPKVRSHKPNLVNLAKVKRDLFGPVDREECIRFAEQELVNLRSAANKRWGFDFSKCEPIPDNQNYTWERVPPTTSEMYTIIRAAHVRETTTSSSSIDYNDLLDERADRSNIERMDVCRDDDAVSSDESSVCNSPVSKVPTSTTSSGKREKQPRQAKITEYMKEKKRLAPAPKKISQPKRIRVSTTTTN